jgi:hypothetical protein
MMITSVRPVTDNTLAIEFTDGEVIHFPRSPWMDMPDLDADISGRSREAAMGAMSDTQLRILSALRATRDYYKAQSGLARLVRGLPC